MSMTDLFSAQQSGRETRGRTPIFRPMLNGDEFDIQVSEAAFQFGENRHDQVTMSVSSTERTNTDGIVNGAISFLFGSAPTTDVFSGYVTDVREVNSSAGSLSWTMTIIGPTKTMQTGLPRFWTFKSVPSVVQNLAYLGYLGFHGHEHPHLWRSVAQTSESDWRTAVRQATKLGWIVYNRYGVVMCYDPLELFTGQGAFMSLISESYDTALAQTDVERSLLAFEPVEESEDKVENMGVKAAFLHDGVLTVATQQGVHNSYRFVDNWVIRDPEEARLYLNAEDSLVDRWKQRATARVLGNAQLYPGMSVDILTKDTRFYRGKFNGRWLIRSVQHSMDRSQFQTNLKLARPGGASVQVTQAEYKPFWELAKRAKPILTYDGKMSQDVLAPGMISAQGMEPELIFLPGDQTIRTPEIVTSDPGRWRSSWTNPTIRDALGTVNV